MRGLALANHFSRFREAFQGQGALTSFLGEGRLNREESIRVV